MKYRLANILAEEAKDTAGVKTIDLNIADPISRLSVFFRGRNSSDTPLAHPAKMITKIELVDGSDVLMSLSGMQAQALDFYHNSAPVINKPMYKDNDWSRMIFNLNFGRWLYDEIYALDPARFKNPQLKITHDKAAGGSTPDGGYMEIWAHCFDEKKISPSGFLMAKEIYSFALGNDAYEYIDLPTDYPYRMMLVRSLKATAGIWELFDKIKLSSDNDKHVIIDGDTRQLLKMLCDQFGPYTETIQGIATGSSIGQYCTPTSNCNILVGSGGGNRDYFQCYQPWGGYFEVVAGSADIQYQALAHGFAPHGAIAIPFGDLKDPGDWFNVGGIGSLLLRLHATSGLTTTDTCDVVLQQLREN